MWRIWDDEFSGKREFHDPPEPPLGVAQAMSMDCMYPFVTNTGTGRQYIPAQNLAI